jgi:hypothetical protein
MICFEKPLQVKPQRQRQPKEIRFMNKKQLGKLPPQYDFFLNPYDDLRFTRCPKCGEKTRQRKLPLVIWVAPHYPVSLNYTCRYCPACNLLIAHQNEIENLLAQVFQGRAPRIIGNEYTVLGTMEKPAWKHGTQKPLDFQDMPEYMHDFKQVLKFDLTHGPGHQESLLTGTKTETGSQMASIDNLPKAMALVEKMKSILPITARPTKDLVNALRKQGSQIDRYRDVQIKDVYYMGDEGGITCDITPPGKEKTPVLCSITHLLIQPEHPLFNEIRIYQEERERTLAKDYGLAGFSITPHKRH